MCGTTSHVWGGSGGRHGAAHEQHRYARDSQTARRKHHGTTEARLCGLGIAASHATRVHWRNEWAANAPQPERENEKHEIVFRALRPDETPAAGLRAASEARACMQTVSEHVEKGSRMQPQPQTSGSRSHMRPCGERSTSRFEPQQYDRRWRWRIPTCTTYRTAQPWRRKELAKPALQACWRRGAGKWCFRRQRQQHAYRRKP